VFDEAAMGLRLDRSSFTSIGGTRRSSQGDSSATATSSAPLNKSCATICCTHVVPDLP